MLTCSALQHRSIALLATVLSLGVYFQKPVAGQQCRGSWYDPRRYTCCADYELCLRGTRILHACCGKHCYSEGNSICCSGRLVDKCSQFHASCCGYRCYKADTELCCDGVIVEYYRDVQLVTMQPVAEIAVTIERNSHVSFHSSHAENGQ
ncbi:hypothetical protein M514_00311 [Trichuris suis]|uniref:Galaxin-like repeats domain-containing protein n=1 Tax=Trichuris suis TaxID=68888 RepID=A0A085MN22_9BILA|nr:hypothetical protein M513_00311 [Trichuris suis]KFD68584.1 hypothetical protein M514_00311 [Trichuris suis]